MIAVIVPLSKLQYNISMSLPQQWLYSRLYKKHNIVGAFSNAPYLDKLIGMSDLIVVELNWMAELYEFMEIVNHCKKLNPKAPILFGGLFAGLHYKTIFERSPVDLFIKGDNEYPMELLFNAINQPEQWTNIPNLVTRTYENPQVYHFREENLFDIEYSLEWFQEYKSRILNHKFFYGFDEEQYKFPFFITAKSGCTCDHRSRCTYCFGSDSSRVMEQYGRPTLEWKAMHFNHLYEHIENFDQYPDISILDNSASFDYENLNYLDKNAYINIDGYVDFKKVKVIMRKFKSVNFIMGTGLDDICENEIHLHEVEKMVEFVNGSNNASIFFYHHHVHSESYPETAIERMYPHLFGHNLNWATNGLEKSESLFEDIANPANFDRLIQLSKETTERYVLPKLLEGK